MRFLDLTKFRYGGNLFDGAAIGDVGLIAPGKTVMKAGRTTGITEGVVNGYTVQIWSDGKETKEIVVIGVDPIFASPGDSGGFLAVDESDGTTHAAGTVIGKNFLNDLVCVTPLQSIIADAGQAFDGLRWSDVE
jgi:hypothetical protein